MPFLNLTYGLLLYEDRSADNNPQIRIPDITKTIQGVVVDNDRSDRLVLAPGETRDIMLTARALGIDATTELSVERPVATADRMRLKWTGNGSSPLFRTPRSIGGDATTQVTLSRVTPYVMRAQQVAGTAWSLATVQIGDIIKFESSTDALASPFNVGNTGSHFLVQAKGANYIDFIDNGAAIPEGPITLGANYSYVLRVFSSGPVKVGDTVTISGSMNPSNQGQFNISDVSSDFIEIINPLGQSETFVYGSNSVTIYEYLIGLLHLRASGQIRLKFDNQAEWATYDRIGEQAVVLASVSAYRIQANNNDPVSDLSISLQYAKVVG